MEYLTANKIIEIHDEIIKEYDGTDGIRDNGTLELLVYKANRENTIFKRAALILHTITAQHPFFDGNKRTALVTAEKVLDDEGYYLDAEAEEKVGLMKNIAEYKISIKTIEKWIKEKAKKITSQLTF
jgi:death-on-curing protein